jgi:hypothetical protein
VVDQGTQPGQVSGREALALQMCLAEVGAFQVGLAEASAR